MDATAVTSEQKLRFDLRSIQLSGSATRWMILQLFVACRTARHGSLLFSDLIGSHHCCRELQTQPQSGGRKFNRIPPKGMEKGKADSGLRKLSKNLFRFVYQSLDRDVNMCILFIIPLFGQGVGVDLGFRGERGQMHQPPPKFWNIWDECRRIGD